MNLLRKLRSITRICWSKVTLTVPVLNIHFLLRTAAAGVPVGQPTHKMGTGVKIVYCIHMTKTQMTDTLQDLQDFMFDTMASQEMAVDWYCDRFEVSATDEVIDFVLDAHDAFFGN